MGVLPGVSKKRTEVAPVETMARKSVLSLNASMDTPAEAAVQNTSLPNMTLPLSAEALRRQCQKQCMRERSGRRMCQEQCQWEEEGRQYERPLTPCANGYVSVPGDFGGCGSIRGRGGFERVPNCLVCANLCDAEPFCRSYECSERTLHCNLNAEATPNRKRFLDYEFCQKQPQPQPWVFAPYWLVSNMCP